MAAGRQRRLPQDSRFSRLVSQGRVELILACALAALVLVLDLITAQPWPPLLLDVLACTAAAATPRWPRLASTALGAILLSYVLFPPDWASLGEYALLIPILGSGMRGLHRVRLVQTIAYFAILAAISWVDAPAGRSPIIGWLLWAVLLATIWLIGNAFAASIKAHRATRETELLRQRQAFARSLHDTVARSLSRVSMAAERARLQGHATDDDLATIADAASRSAEELRWLMAVLRDSPVDSEMQPASTLDVALAEAQHDLNRHGFTVAVTVEGSLERLTDEQGEALGAITAEAVSNIIKHADSEVPCAIIVDIGETVADIVFVNRPSDAANRLQHHQPMGLVNSRDRLASIGGDLAIESHPHQWSARVRVPLLVPTPVRDRVA